MLESPDAGSYLHFYIAERRKVLRADRFLKLHRLPEGGSVQAQVADLHGDGGNGSARQKLLELARR